MASSICSTHHSYAHSFLAMDIHVLLRTSTYDHLQLCKGFYHVWTEEVLLVGIKKNYVECFTFSHLLVDVYGRDPSEESPGDRVDCRHRVLGLVRVDLGVREVLFPHQLCRFGRDVVLVERRHVLDKLGVAQDPLGRAPEVVHHLGLTAATGAPGVRHPVRLDVLQQAHGLEVQLEADGGSLEASHHRDVGLAQGDDRVKGRVDNCKRFKKIVVSFAMGK